MSEKQTQQKMIAQYLKNGGRFTTLEAIELFGCLHPATRVLELKRQGMDIRTDIVTDPNTGKRFASYWLFTGEEESVEPAPLPIVSPLVPVYESGAENGQ